jgi:hypothetical protein
MSIGVSNYYNNNKEPYHAREDRKEKAEMLSILKTIYENSKIIEPSQHTFVLDRIVKVLKSNGVIK